MSHVYLLSDHHEKNPMVFKIILKNTKIVQDGQIYIVLSIF